ncbi:MAG: class I SAM-dependent methyltransferase [Patescibacteria group bacterium]
MNSKTQQLLNNLNQQFYQTVWSEFDVTRQKAWEGWSKLLQFLWKQPQPLRVLDAGCGNGRFGEFLTEHIHELEYVGIDNSAELLTAGRKKLFKGKFIALDLMNKQRISELEGTYDVIVLIAVLHHIPSFDERAALLKRLKQKLNKGGLLIFTAWQFTKIPQLKERIIPWTKCPDLDQTQLEKNDFLLDWQRGEHAIRYCHLIDQKEIERLVETLSLTKVAQFYADGKENQSNIYVVLQK